MDIQYCRPAGGLKELEATHFRSYIIVCLGVFIATSERAEVIACGLRHITQLTGEAAFGGRGSAGPQHCMTNDCEAEERALTLTWPTVKRFLCTFHIGQAARRE